MNGSPDGSRSHMGIFFGGVVEASEDNRWVSRLVTWSPERLDWLDGPGGCPRLGVGRWSCFNLLSKKKKIFE